MQCIRSGAYNAKHLQFQVQVLQGGDERFFIPSVSRYNTRVMGIQSSVRLLKFFLFAHMALFLVGCDAKVKLERRYELKNFFGRWQAEFAVITNSAHEGKSVRIGVPRYGQIVCKMDSDSTFSLDVNVVKDVTLEDDQSWLSIQHVLVHGGYKIFLTGTYYYKDSIADFYNYNRQRHFSSVLYTLGDRFYLTYTDEKENKWKLQFARAN